MTSLLTRAFLKANTVAFFPASAGEAIYLQQRLAELGCRWKSGDRMSSNPEHILGLGLIVQRGTMFIGNEDVSQEYIVATVRDLSAHLAPAPELEARVVALEEKLDRVLALLSPQNAPLKLSAKGPPKP